MQESDKPVLAANTALEHASAIVAAYVGHNPMPASELPAIIRSVHAALAGLGSSGSDGAVAAQKPAVPIKRSVFPDHLVCLEDGKKLTMLKRYIRSRFGLSPDEYRTKWGLPRDYPMVAPEYAERRSQFAKQSGLGTKRKAPAAKKRKRG